jgi:hypothetical protein
VVDNGESRYSGRDGLVAHFESAIVTFQVVPSGEGVGIGMC